MSVPRLADSLRLASRRILESPERKDRILLRQELARSGLPVCTVDRLVSDFLLFKRSGDFVLVWLRDQQERAAVGEAYPNALGWAKGAPYNQHLWFQFTGSWFKQIYPERESGQPLARALLSRSPRQPFREAAHAQLNTSRHFGQRKLLIAEIEFLTLFGCPGMTVVYPGSAPGTHLPMLIRLFPLMSYVLVDPAFTEEDARRLGEAARGLAAPCSLEVLAERFESEGGGRNSARFWAGRPDVLLISDVRLAAGNRPTDAEVRQDMDLQAEWARIMRPVAGMLKFRLPWEGEVVAYLPGQIRLPIWGKPLTAESRLVFTREDVDAEPAHYDSTVYCDQMYHFNTVLRKQLWPGLGRCRCYDCMAELHVLAGYARKFGRERPPLSLRDLITEGNPRQDPATSVR